MLVWGTLRKAACFRRFSRYYIRCNNSAEMLAPWERFCMDCRCAIEEVAASQRGDALVEQLARLWERSVRATHLFLSEDDIVVMRPEVREGLRAVPQLAVAFDDGAPLGFAGVADGKLEMLFVDDAARGRGIGSALLKHAVDRWGVHRLDVNEQNPAARGFYEHEGFRVASRSELDEAGRPFPLLHMERCSG